MDHDDEAGAESETGAETADAAHDAGGRPGAWRWQGPAGLAAIAVVAGAAVVAVGGNGVAGAGPGVDVVETGFSSPPGSYRDVAYGVVVENTGDEVAYHTVACVSLVEDGEDDGPGCREFAIEVLLPGQRVGFGAVDPGPSDGGRVTEVAVEIDGPASWEEPDESHWAEIVVSDLAVAYSRENHPVVSFARWSEYQFDEVRNATAYTVLRDADGDIVGAAGIDLDGPVRPQEQVRHSIALDVPIPDLATAEVYVFPSGL